MRISDWSSDVCSSDLDRSDFTAWREQRRVIRVRGKHAREPFIRHVNQYSHAPAACMKAAKRFHQAFPKAGVSWPGITDGPMRSEEHTSELQSLMRNSYAVFCLKKKNKRYNMT